MRASNALLAAIATGAIVAIACDGKHDIKINGGDAGSATIARRDTGQKLGPGDLRIATTDSAMELALIGDSLVAGFGASTREKIKEATDTSKVSSNGLGASIEKMVKSQVAGALIDHEMHVPLSDVSDIKYQDGMLVLYGRDGKKMHLFERDKGKSKPSQFSEADAKDFIALFKAKTGRA
jgi:hypothetical protein